MSRFPTKTTSFQCPDTGVIVSVKVDNRGFLRADSDADDESWAVADAETRSKTESWVRRVINRGKVGSVEEAEQFLVNVMGVEMDDLDPWHW